MKTTSIRAFIIMLSLVICECFATAQTAQRIQFAKGKSSAVVKGSTGTTGAYYVVRANSGQKLILNLDPTSGTGIKVETDGRYGHTVLLREEKGGTYEVGLEESGDYSIFIGSTTDKPVSFTLMIKITKMTDI
jgi:hypothetical protein